jgi:hypothetical protein
MTDTCFDFFYKAIFRLCFRKIYCILIILLSNSLNIVLHKKAEICSCHDLLITFKYIFSNKGCVRLKNCTDFLSIKYSILYQSVILQILILVRGLHLQVLIHD